MKKIISVMLIAAFTACLFSSCVPTSYVLNESQRNEVFSSGSGSDVSAEKERPLAEDIIGIYDIYGVSEKSNNESVTAHVSSKEGKIILQVTQRDKKPLEVTDEIFANISSAYDPETGRFEQSYIGNKNGVKYTSIYEVYFSVEDGNIKIDLQNIYYYHDDGVLRTSLKAMGYKNPAESATESTDGDNNSHEN